MTAYSRDQMVEMYGEEFITKLEEQNCQPTNRVGTIEYYNGNAVNLEWSAGLWTPNKDEDIYAMAWYLQKISDFIDPTTNEPYEDLDMVDWKIAYYTVE